MRKKVILFLSVILSGNILLLTYYGLAIKSKEEKINFLLSEHKIKNNEYADKNLSISSSNYISVLEYYLINTYTIIFLFLINIFILLYIAKNLELTKNKQENLTYLDEKSSIIKLFKKFLSHDIRKPFNLSKMLISAIKEDKPKLFIENVSNEVEKSIKKIEDFCDSYLVYCNSIDIQSSDIFLQDLDNFLKENLKEEKSIVFKKNELENIKVKINSVYLGRAIKSLLSFLKAQTVQYHFYLSTNSGKNINSFINITLPLVGKESMSVTEYFKNSYMQDFEFQIIQSLFQKNNCQLIISLNDERIDFNIFLPNS
ncbi:hypothetical protein QEJ31_08775 [Pigmentibacter sp. JX0631]|uniref:hypothetical protein n=1 Tax=Pigmentibacter sp. JX0631 TaxID=2976982 RepID=UPI0024697114|nr:hypothetical protein [Pigmentibacter sp. JX0631]WGL58627.1 hypothetical protein QEJ31_08775 [Pigmentibacter sp. JX0631]